jgi:hypothetical protein
MEPLMQKGRDRESVQLDQPEWQCVEGKLVTHTLLRGSTDATDGDLIDESVVRLWKSSDGVLIAENNLDRRRDACPWLVSISGSLRLRPSRKLYEMV